MKKIFLILVVILLLGGFAWYFFFRSTDPVPGPEQMVVQGQSEKVVIHDVYTAPSPERKPIVFNADKDVLLSDTEEHHMLYYTGDQSFHIVLLNSPLQPARETAEKIFLENLKIDEATACKLKVSLRVPYSVNEEASGEDYGLSFCPNGKPLPPL